MGRKRRLISAYEKFKAKHSNHPLILRKLDEDEEVKIQEPVVEAEEEPVVEAEEDPVVVVKEEPVVVKEEKIEEPPKPKVRKKRARPKKTTKKENR